MMKLVLFLSFIVSMGCFAMHDNLPEGFKAICSGKSAKSYHCKKLADLLWCTQALDKKPFSRGALVACQRTGNFRHDGSPNSFYDNHLFSYHLQSATKELGDSKEDMARLRSKWLDEMRQKNSNQKGT